jgi:hypothetical protein
MAERSAEKWRGTKTPLDFAVTNFASRGDVGFSKPKLKNPLLCNPLPDCWKAVRIFDVEGQRLMVWAGGFDFIAIPSQSTNQFAAVAIANIHPPAISPHYQLSAVTNALQIFPEKENNQTYFLGSHAAILRRSSL